MKMITVNSPFSPIKGEAVPAKEFKSFFGGRLSRPSDDWAWLVEAHYRAACHFHPIRKASHDAFLKESFAKKLAEITGETA